MPPPLLSRHLRPCQPSWNAQSVRRASSAHVKFPPASDDQPGSKSADGGSLSQHNEASDRPTSWWSSALASVSTLGFRTASQKAEAPSLSLSSPPAPQSTPRIDATAPRSPVDTRTAELRIRRHAISSSGQQTVAAVRQVPSTNGWQAKRELTSKRKKTQGEAHTVTGPSAVASTAVRGDGQAPIHVQLQQLFEQVKKLQETLAEKNATPQRASSLESKAAISKPVRPSPSSHTPRSLRYIIHDNPVAAQEHYEVRAERLLRQARTQLRQSYQLFVAAVNILESSENGQHAPVTSWLRKRIAIIACEAIADKDSFTLGALSKYRKVTFKQLISNELSVVELASSEYESFIIGYVLIVRDLEQLVSPAAAPLVSRTHEQLGRLAKEKKPRSSPRLRELLKKYHMPSSRQNTARQHIVSPPRSIFNIRTSNVKPVRAPPSQHKDIFANSRSGYRRTDRLLRSIAKDLERMQSPVIKDILVQARARWSTAAKKAKTKHDEEVQSGTSRVPPISKYLVEAKDFVAERKGDGHIIHRLDLRYKGSLKKAAAPPSTVAGTDDSSDLVTSGASTTKPSDSSGGDLSNGQRLAHHIHTQSGLMKSSDHPLNVPLIAASKDTTTKRSIDTPDSEPSDHGHVSNHLAQPKERATVQSGEVGDQTLLDELFPEAHPPAVPSHPSEKEDKYPKLDLPEPDSLVRRAFVDRPKTLKEQVVGSFMNSGEKITLLQLEHCSTALAEIDFRRLIPKGQHIEDWNRGGEFYKLIPGRDPLSLERLPFYYLLFKTPESAHAYQNNVTRLHKLAALHQPSNIFSAVPPPCGFLEDGEDVNAITKSYLLKPTEHPVNLRMVMQPYHPALRSLIERGGYHPIVPEVDEKDNRVYKVLLHIEGYEPSKQDLVKILRRDAYIRGTFLNLRNESTASVHRLREVINLRTRTLPISTTNPRAFGHFESASTTPTERANVKVEFEDPNIRAFMQGDNNADEDNAKEVNQMVMNCVYNRWLLEFDDEDEARRFAVLWHRRVLPDPYKGDKTWKDYEEVRMCNCEFLW